MQKTEQVYRNPKFEIRRTLVWNTKKKKKKKKKATMGEASILTNMWKLSAVCQQQVFIPAMYTLPHSFTWCFSEACLSQDVSENGVNKLRLFFAFHSGWSTHWVQLDFHSSCFSTVVLVKDRWPGASADKSCMVRHGHTAEKLWRERK